MINPFYFKNGMWTKRKLPLLSLKPRALARLKFN